MNNDTYLYFRYAPNWNILFTHEGLYATEKSRLEWFSLYYNQHNRVSLYYLCVAQQPSTCFESKFLMSSDL